jgi:hypothetical protein
VCFTRASAKGSRESHSAEADPEIGYPRSGIFVLVEPGMVSWEEKRMPDSQFAN